MKGFYRKEDIDGAISGIRTTAESAFFAEGKDPGQESDFLKGYGSAIDAMEKRFRIIDEKKGISVVE